MRSIPRRRTVVHAVHLIVERKVRIIDLARQVHDVEAWALELICRRSALIVAWSAGCVHVALLPALLGRLRAHACHEARELQRKLHRRHGSARADGQTWLQTSTITTLTGFALRTARHPVCGAEMILGRMEDNFHAASVREGMPLARSSALIPSSSCESRCVRKSSEHA